MQDQLIFLGTGTSQGVPIIGCNCEVCSSKDPHDHRLRTSALLQYKDKNILFDTSADFRGQLLSEGITNIDYVLFTHEHRDHTAGLDELRPITWKREDSLPIYAEQRVLTYLHAAFPHIMGGKPKYPGGAKLREVAVDKTPFALNDEIQVIPIRMTHFQGLPILGFRIDKVAYLTDCKTIDNENLNKLKDLDVLVINALGKKEHPSHLSLSDALEIIDYLKPKQAYLTHIGHAMGYHKDVQKELPENVYLAYDGLKVSLVAVK
ncbi:phosphoribosyl 1,2-cyclic phosphate phosphodiesterase [Balneicella halophila]|uniref:Phosphoribosyl 1,2-cyclic phosphate phosphodiesterase n=1 Tax=Balneicella halophila TaxID=1537566 RepID=A0A7L4UNF6_BALHA|nr:MBL fold metallo-hydrolase [Balneicella halophila]PVX49868.1 phosphoribosyl 1,2-cyclic phosphate phosphodiesterase [Balneicella halophila]